MGGKIILLLFITNICQNLNLVESHFVPGFISNTFNKVKDSVHHLTDKIFHRGSTTPMPEDIHDPVDQDEGSPTTSLIDVLVDEETTGANLNTTNLKPDGRSIINPGKNCPSGQRLDKGGECRRAYG